MAEADDLEGQAFPAGQVVQDVVFPVEYDPEAQAVGNALVFGHS